MNVEISKKELDDLNIFASILGHIGDGNFHESIMYNRHDPEQYARVEKCVYDMVDRALAMEGSCTVRFSPSPYPCTPSPTTPNKTGQADRILVLNGRANTASASAKKIPSSKNSARTRST